MGSGASSPRSATAGIEAAAKAITDKDLEVHFEGLSPEVRAKLFAALNKTMAPKGAYTVYYHTKCEKFFGRAYPILLVLEHAGAKYECKAPDEAPEGSGFVTAPACLTPSGACIAQTPAIVMMLSEELGLAPTSEPFRSQFKKLNIDAADFLQECFDKKADDRLKKWAAYFEGTLAKNGSGLFCGPTVSGADYMLLFAIRAATENLKLDISGCEKLSKWKDMMMEQPSVKKLAEKNLPMLPPS